MDVEEYRAKCYKATDGGWFWLSGKENYMYRFKLAALISLLCVAPSFGDEIIFRNGDRLTGTITGADAGKLNITTPVAGAISVPMDEVKTFSTDEPITLKMRDGNLITDKIAADGVGSITVRG